MYLPIFLLYQVNRKMDFSASFLPMNTSSTTAEILQQPLAATQTPVAHHDPTPNISTTDGLPCTVVGGLKACNDNILDKMVTGAATGGAAGAVTGAGAIPGATAGAATGGLGGCVMGAIKHLHGC